MPFGYRTCKSCGASKPAADFPLMVNKYRSGRALVVIRKRNKTCRVCWDAAEQRCNEFAKGLFSKLTEGASGC